MSKKQTSIEWLIDQLKSIPLAKDKDEFTNGDIMDIVNKAKQLHKQEIIAAHGQEQHYLQFDGSWKMMNGEQYYEETFTENE